MTQLDFWTLTATLTAVQVDYTDIGAVPDLQRISGTVDIIPRIIPGTLIFAPGLTPKQCLALATMRARFDTDGVLRTIGANAVDETQTISIVGSPTSATLSFSGQTTTSIPSGSAASVVETKLEALSTINGNNVTVTGTWPNYTVSFVNLLGKSDQPLLSGATTGGTGAAVNVTTTRAGTAAAGVQLVANTDAIALDELYYDLSFKNIVYARDDQSIAPMAIKAPTVGGGTFDLSELEHFIPKPGLL